jgi:hypothetical protein
MHYHTFGNGAFSWTFYAMRYDPSYAVPYVGIATPKENIASITVYPNPVSSTLHIQMEDSSEKIERAEIYDLTGKKMGEYYSLEFSVAILSPGMYLLKVFTNQNQYINKFIKINN